MIIISHRGNLHGKNPCLENSPAYVLAAAKVCCVEIDVWYHNGLFLGHDEPLYPITDSFLSNPSFWCHAKNIQALLYMIERSNIHCFWHEKDQLTLTSNGYVWSYPGMISSGIIVNQPERTIDIRDLKSVLSNKELLGVCSDFAGDLV